MWLRELDVAKKAALESGKTLMNYYGKVSIRYKADRSITTDADIFSEKKINSILKNEFPEYGFLGEEFGLEKGSSDNIWIVDPLDGTTNYCMQNPFFSVSIALARKNELVMGIVYYPVMDEFFSAEKGKGACLNGEQISVSDTSNVHDSIISFCHGRDQNHVREMVHIFSKLKSINSKVRQIGSTALELCYVACGRTGAFFGVGTNIWDIAAGVLMVGEANGTVSDFDANPFCMDSKHVLASNDRIHKQLLRLMLDN